MIGFSFRPLSGSAMYLRGAARRLAAKLRGKAGVKTEIHDGYLLRAVGSTRSVTVTAIDPEALWLFLHHQGIDGTVGEAGTSICWSLGTRGLSRGVLVPGTPVPDDEALTPADDARYAWAPGFGRLGTVYSGTGPNLNTASIPHVRPDRVAVTVLLNTADFVIGNTSYETKFQLYGHTADPMRRKLLEEGADTSQLAVRGADVRDWVLSEAGMRSAIEDPLFQFFPRGYVSFGHIPVFSAQVARDVRTVVDEEAAPWYADVVVAGAYVTQPSLPAEGEETADRQAGLFITRLRRPTTAGASTYSLTHLWSVLIPATASPVPNMQPLHLAATDTLPDRYEYHGVSTVGMAVVPAEPDESEGAMLVAGLYRVGDTAVYTALQAVIVNADGAGASYTVRTGDHNRQWRVGPECALFGVNGVLVIEATLETPMGLSLWHVGVDGVARETGLQAAGWQPYTQQNTTAASFDVAAGWGQAGVWAADIGGNRVAVLAVDHDRNTDEESIVWSVVALNATTGEFVEVLGALPATGNYFGYSAHLSVVTPTVLREDDSVLAEAVLLASLFEKHYLSRDGGRTWTLTFDGFYGFPVYLGNRLHKVEIGKGL